MTPSRAKPTHTPNRVIRVSDEVWQAAQRAAADKGETLSEAVRKFLVRYGKGH